jgi:hypothetical protein
LLIVPILNLELSIVALLLDTIVLILSCSSTFNIFSYLNMSMNF